MILVQDGNPTTADYKKQMTETTCKWCSLKRLDKEPIQSYPHEDGWPLLGYAHRRWLYIVCPQCHYEWALWKLGVPRYVSPENSS